MGNNPEFFSEVVYLRAIAILAVISIHVSAYFTKMDISNFLTFFYMSVNTFSHFAVPLFVCISGFVLYNKYRGSYSLKIFYKKRLLSVVPQYTIFSALGILFMYADYKSGRFPDFAIKNIIYQYLTGTAYYHLWFFVIIIQLYVLYPLIEKIFSKSLYSYKIFLILIFVLIVQILYQIFFIKDMVLIGAATLFLGYIFYFVLGMYVRSHYFDVKNAIMTLSHPYILFLAFLSATILGIWIQFIEYFRSLNQQLTQIYIWIYGIATPLYYTLIFILCLHISLKISTTIPNKITTFIKIIGNYSFGIYLIHAFILDVIASLLLPKFGFDMNNWLFYPIVFTFVLSSSLALAYIINKIPYSEYIIGSVR
jgi:surface polysaccharide O-acyltransferase-like enzyme